MLPKNIQKQVIKDLKLGRKQILIKYSISRNYYEWLLKKYKVNP